MQRAFSVWPLLLVLLGGAALAVCQWLIFFYAPVEAQLGLMQKVFYTHLPLAWWALISFLVVNSNVSHLLEHLHQVLN